MTTIETVLTDEQKNVRNAVVRALWTVDSAGTTYDSIEAKKAAFTEHSPTYVQKANRLIRQLDQLGVSLSMRLD